MDAPAVAVNSDGKTFAYAWMDMRGGRNQRRVYVRLLDKSPDDKPLADDPKSFQGHPSLAFGPTGLHATWEDMRSGVQRIHYRSPAGKDSALSPAKGKASFPSLACGKVVGVAYELDGAAVFSTAP